MIKPYLTYIGLIIIASVLTYAGLTVYQAGQASIQSKFDEYKDIINDQVQAAKNEKIRIESEQRQKLDKAKLDYSDSSSKLAAALKRLRESQNMSWNCSLPMAGRGSDTMPRGSENSGNNIVKLATFRGTCDYSFYEAAMRQTLQCQALIDFVK